MSRDVRNIQGRRERNNVFGRIVLASAVLLSGSVPAWASEARDTAPVLPGPAQWAGVMVIIVLGLFLASAVIGPIVRAHLPEDAPPPHHDDHDDHGHGRHAAH